MTRDGTTAGHRGLPAVPAPLPVPAPAQRAGDPPEPWSRIGTELVEELSVGWRFVGEHLRGSEGMGFDDSGCEIVSVPHCAVPLGWRDWEPSDWERKWVYRRSIELPESLEGRRWLLEWSGVMTGCEVWLNGERLGSHLGGYLPFRFELGDHARPGRNLLAVTVDGRWQNVPPQGPPGGAASIDFLEPAGLYREVVLRGVPECFIDDVFVAGKDVLGPRRRLEVSCDLDGVEHLGESCRIVARVRDGGRVIAEASADLERRGGAGSPLRRAPEAGSASPGPESPRSESPGPESPVLELSGLEGLALWDVDSPALYEVDVELRAAGDLLHSKTVRFGLREARFTENGFLLNGRPLKIRGLNRHQLFPYRGMAMAARAQRRDAELLRVDLACNMVRCSHYPQSPHFLDACDELGLLVWEEVPGWGYIGDEQWQERLLRDVGDMVRRDRNRPSIVVWGVRANESPNDPVLYGKARRIAYELDGGRPTSGSMIYHSTTDWGEDVFAFDDYKKVAGGLASLEEPIPGVPYLVSEAVGALSGHPYYRRDDLQAVQAHQGFLHARVLDKVASDPRYLGLIGWCGIDYASLNGNTYRHMKWPGVVDTFRVPKPGAAIYMAQAARTAAIVIEPAFYWFFGEGCSVLALDEAMICSNCEELRILVGGELWSELGPDRERFASLELPPFFASFSGVNPREAPELVIEGIVGGEVVGVRHLSSDVRCDKLEVVADDPAIRADGVDLTRVVIAVTDRYGALRPRAAGKVVVLVDGPGEAIGDCAFELGDGGPLRAVWVRGRQGRPGRVRISAAHRRYGSADALVDTLP